MGDTISLWQLLFPLVFSNLSTSPLLLVPRSCLFFLSHLYNPHFLNYDHLFELAWVSVHLGIWKYSLDCYFYTGTPVWEQILQYNKSTMSNSVQLDLGKDFLPMKGV